MDIFSLFSRRNILAGIFGTAVAAGGAFRFTSPEEFSLLLRPRGRGRRGVPLHTAARDDWTAQIGTLFTADTGQILELTDVQGFPEKGERPDGLRESAFSVQFEIKRGGAFGDDRIRRFRHAEGGVFDILLSRESDPLQMHAIFN